MALWIGVAFESADSGEEDAPVIYTSYPGERVRFTGSVKVAIWRRSKKAKHIRSRRSTIYM